MVGLNKNYPVFDCDAHVTEVRKIWDYLSASEAELLKQWYWPQGVSLVVNGDKPYAAAWGYGYRRSFGFHGEGRRVPSVIEISGPGVTKKHIRKLYSMELTAEQCDMADHAGARDARARVRDLDLMGIDQVVVIPLQIFSPFLFVQNANAAAAFARAYNNYIHDWCSEAPDRLFAAAALPIHNPIMAAEELHRVAKMGFKVAMVRPVDVQGRYPNQVATEPLWRAFEETGLVVGMHSLVTGGNHLIPGHRQWTPGLFVERAVNESQMPSPSQTLSFIHEAQTWLTNVLLSGFLERHPGITRMAIMESNAGWLPMLLDELDRAYHLYAYQRKVKVTRLPSEIFLERCFIAFEGDETPVYRQHSYFQDIGIWSSDVYHHDGADAWSAIREMEKLEVPEAVQAKLMGDNARRMYGIEPRSFVTAEPESYPPRPSWWPKEKDLEREYAGRMVKS